METNRNRSRRLIFALKVPAAVDAATTTMELTPINPCSVTKISFTLISSDGEAFV